MFSTHDWTPFVTYFPNPTLNPFDDAWADCKTPGGMPRFDFSSNGFTPDRRRTYCVGTTEVNTTLDHAHTWTSGTQTWTVPPASFSGKPVGTAGLATLGFATENSTDRRQVVILQCNRTDRGTDASGAQDENGIVWQQYFYGQTSQSVGELLDYTHATNARAISVWEADAIEDTRIAICGETEDQRIPLSQSSSSWVGGEASGYIAVLDGDGNLQWTYHFFTSATPPLACAVTDVAVRVDAEGRTIVTYCGITENGDPGVGSALHPVLPFLAPDSGLPAPTTGLSGGATLQTPGQGRWDGFVGRLIYTPATQTTAATLVQLFHSTVSGPGQDGLFGLAEISPDRFVVVGSTEAAAGEEGFPIFFGGGGLLTAPYQVGVALLFDASQTTLPSPGNLILEQSLALGAPNGNTATIARDVAVGLDVSLDRTVSGQPGVYQGAAIYVVGSTNDADFRPTASPLTPAPGTSQPSWVAAPAPTQGGTFGGGADGFVAVLHDDIGVGLWPQTFCYWGGVGSDGLNGVSCWSEFPEHIAVTGFTPQGSSTDNGIGVTTYLLNNCYGPGVPAGSNAAPNNTGLLLRLREDVVGGTRDDRPTVMGNTNATDDADTGGLVSSGAFSTFQLGQPAAGGGVSVANDGRVTTVGRTSNSGTTYPVEGVNPRPLDLGRDAVRTDLDMVPKSQSGVVGVGRTDGTGYQMTGAVFPIAGYSGGTTPTCGLAPFGRRIGEALPGVARMLIDYEGEDPEQGVDNAAIVVTRPATVSGSVTAGLLMVGFPQNPPPVWEGVEYWMDLNSAVMLLDVWPANRSYRVPQNVLPTGGSGTVSFQLHCLLDLTPGSGFLGFTPVTHAPGCASTFVASPALWFTF
ncbi:MAG: hypothetical protein K8J09_14010 [Planctomycetes bacterium]|nr:hypothetical protein [Planctomycetota bacterium]MCC7398073.1 hypothetical protein [Planctomycetota bacterium]